jgi:beta-N-acetylhexosaminidase
VSLRRLALGTLLGAFNGSDVPVWVHDLTSEGIAGFVLFKENVDDAAALCSSLRVSRPDLLIAIDEEGGDVTRLWRRLGSPYPGNAALGVADDPDLTRSIYAAIGSHLVAVGVNVDLAPVADVNSTADNPVIGTRSFGAEPALVSRHTAAAVRGLQDAGVSACAKHFPGHGATTVDSHLGLPVVDATETAPFRAAVDAGVRAVMTAHIRVPSLTGAAPATFSRDAIRLLRSELGFQGTIITDALEMRGATAYAGGIPAGAVLALGAGADLLCVGARVTPDLIEAIVAEIVAAVADGRLPESRLIDAAARVEALAAVSTPVPARTPVDDDGGIGRGVSAAGRAITLEGTPPDLSRALYVQLTTETSIAEGRVPWGLVPAYADGIVTEASSGAVKAVEIASIAGDRPIVVVVRGVRRVPGAYELVEALATTHPVVLVEMGQPARPWPHGIRATVITYGASRANSLAALDALRRAR